MRAQLVVAITLVCCSACGHGAKNAVAVEQIVGDAAAQKNVAKETKHSEKPSYRTLRVGIAPEIAFDTMVTTLAQQTIPTEIVSKEGGVIRTVWTEGVRVELHLLGTVCTMQGESKTSGEDLKGNELGTFNRIASALETALGSATAQTIVTPTPAPTAAPATAMEAARRAIEKSGLKIEQSNDATGRLETSWNASEFAAVNISDQNIDYRVRYVVQVTGKSASARAETEKTTDHRSWVPRNSTTKKEESQLEKLRHALREELDAMPAR